jgi:hypothetical protein
MIFHEKTLGTSKDFHKSKAMGMKGPWKVDLFFQNLFFPFKDFYKIPY